MKTTVYMLSAFAMLASAPAAWGDVATDSLHAATHHLEEVTVSGLAGTVKQRQSSAPVAVVSSKALESTPSTNIIDAIATQPGVSQLTTGPGISKPVIRGLSYNRLVVVNNGLRQEGQQWGDEHGVEADAVAVGSVEILKGPATLAYGSDAMAGVIVLKPHPVPSRPLAIAAAAQWQSNDGLLGASAAASGRRDRIFWRVGASGKMAHDMRVPHWGTVGGSAFRDCGATAMAGLTDTWGVGRLSAAWYHMRPGMMDRLDQGSRSYSIHEPYQVIDHASFTIDNNLNIGSGRLQTTLGWQHNSRNEYEDEDEHEHHHHHHESDEACEGMHLKLNTVNYNAAYSNADIGARVSYQGGVSGMWQRSVNRGDEFLIPDYRLFDIGFFSAVQRSFGPVTANGGLRYNLRHVTSDELEDDGESRFNAFKRTFGALTGSIGAAMQFCYRNNLKLNLSRGYRAPNISELASNGVHHGTQHYEVGDTRLHPEHSLQLDLGYEYACDLWHLEIAIFFNDIDNYIFLRGENFAEDGLPVYAFTQGHARLWGGEVSFDVHPLAHIHLLNEFSLVKSRLLHQAPDARYLPFTPAPRLRSELRYDLIHAHSHPLGHVIDNLWVSANCEVCLRQRDCYLAGDTETPTPSYTLLGAGAGVDFHRGFSICLAATNLLDRRYFSHLSRLKYIGDGIPNPGRNVTLKLVCHI